MISIRTGDDFRYYLAATTEPSENYYTGATRAGEPAGRWSGRGAEAVGLSGEVTATQMEALFGHRIDPRDDRFTQPSEWAEAARVGGPRRRYATAEEAYEKALAAEPDASGERREELRLNAGRTARRNVQYLDITFSVQKSISVLHLAFDRARVEAERVGDTVEAAAWATYRDAVEAAIWAGNAAALEYLQDEAGFSRIGHHGGAAGRFIDAHDWIATSFFQHDSRDGDPQLHIHNPILNLAESSDGTWRTLDSLGISRHRGAAAAIAERVTEEYLARTVGVPFLMRPDGKAREVAGIGARVIELLSTRRRVIGPKAAQLAAEFETRFGRPPNPLELDRLKRRATLGTRKAKSREIESLEERGERLDQVVRELRAEVDEGLAGVARHVVGLTGRPAAPPYSPTAVIETALADVQAGRSTWTRAELLRAISDALPDSLGGLDARDVRRLLDGLTDAALAHAGVTQVSGEREEDRPLVDELRLEDGRSAYAGPASVRYALRGHLDAERALQRAATEVGAPAVSPDAAVAAAVRVVADGLTLGPDQHRALTGILTSGAKVETLVGPAGTGKSTVVGALARAWTDPTTWDGTTERRVVGLAASQVATDVLAGEGLAARNVTRWLASQQRIAADEEQPDDAGWRLAAGDLVVVDEAAMLPTADLTAVHGYVAAAGAKLLLTGDHRQLAAVGAGGGMQLLARAGGHELTEVHRFAAGWEGPASLRLRDGDDTVLHTYRRHGRLIDGGTPEQARSSAARAWLADTLAGRQSVLVVGTNEEAAQLSAETRAELVRFGLVEDDGVPLGRDGTTAGVGDLVQGRRNGWELAGRYGNERAPINRETYRVTETREDGALVVERTDGERLTLPASYVAEDLTLGYAGTVHSTQGRTVDTAHVVAGAGTSPAALYVGMTRGRDGNHAHVITRPADETQPVGAAHAIPPADPLAVLTSVVGTEAADLGGAATQQAADDEHRRASVQTAIERFAAEAEMVYTTRTAAALDRLTADGVLSVEQRLAFADDAADSASLARLLRTAELAGHDPDEVLRAAVAERSYEGALSLSQVTYRRIERQLAGRLAPAVTSYADMVPSVPSPAWRDQLAGYAEAADARRRELGEQTADEQPQWAAEALGPVPTEPTDRLAWEHRAGTVAAWRELAGHTDDADPLGPVSRPAQPEQYAVWRAGWTALGRPEPARVDAELSPGQLRVRIRAYQRETNWAPAYVGESLTATTLAAEARHRDARLLAARAAASTDLGEAEKLTSDAADTSALADLLTARAAQLEEADEARSRWLVHTAVTREAADRARAELAARGVPVGAEADDAVTPAEWLAAHAADQAEDDRRRPIVAEHDLADVVEQRAADLAVVTATDEPLAEVDVSDARDITAKAVGDDEGVIPTAAESETAVRRAQAALREIERRRAVEDRRVEIERRTAQLHRWARDDRERAVADADQQLVTE